MKNYRIEIKWTLAFAVMAIVWNLFERLAGFHTVRIAMQQTVNVFILVPAVALYLLALLDKRKNFYNGVMTYRQGFWSGFILSVFISLFSPVYSLLNLRVVSPDFFDNATAYAVSSGAMSQVQAEQTFNLSSYIVIGIGAGIVTGVLMTAVIMLFLRNRKDVAIA